MSVSCFQIATLLKTGNKNVDIKFSAHERFLNNLHQVAQDQKIGKPNNLIVLGAQNLWVLMLCRSFDNMKQPAAILVHNTGNTSILPVSSSICNTGTDTGKY